jgi:hypothetical protein
MLRRIDFDFHRARLDNGLVRHCSADSQDKSELKINSKKNDRTTGKSMATCCLSTP